MKVKINKSNSTFFKTNLFQDYYTFNLIYIFNLFFNLLQYRLLLLELFPKYRSNCFLPLLRSRPRIAMGNRQEPIVVRNFATMRQSSRRCTDVFAKSDRTIFIDGATRRVALGVADVAAARQDDRIISGGDPVNNSANIVWHFERVLRDGDVSRGVGRSACAYTSTYLRLLWRRSPAGERIESRRALVYPGTERAAVPSVSNNAASRIALAVIVSTYCFSDLLLPAMRARLLAGEHRSRSYRNRVESGGIEVEMLKGNQRVVSKTRSKDLR